MTTATIEVEVLINQEILGEIVRVDEAIGGELAKIEQAKRELLVYLVSSGASLAVIKATLTEGVALGYAVADIAPSKAQHFQLAVDMLNSDKGAEMLTVKELLSLALRLNKAHGSQDAPASVIKAESILDLDAETPSSAKTQSVRSGKSGKGSTPSVVTPDSAILGAIDLLKSASKKSLKDMKVTDLKALATLAEMVNLIAKNNLIIKK